MDGWTGGQVLSASFKTPMHLLHPQFIGLIIHDPIITALQNQPNELHQMLVRKKSSGIPILRALDGQNVMLPGLGMPRRQGNRKRKACPRERIGEEQARQPSIAILDDLVEKNGGGGQEIIA
jgi:hypothetical protein